jgi:hypothetical protein
MNKITDDKLNEAIGLLIILLLLTLINLGILAFYGFNP